MHRATAAHWAELQGLPGATRARRTPRWSDAGVGVLVLAATVLVAVRAAGMQTLTVLTGSMRPAIDPGDLVLVDRVAPTAARPGDVVTFRSPDGRRRTITHRVVRVRRTGAQVAFTTRGDANPAPERWSVASDGRIGRVVLVVPVVGWIARPAAAGWSRAVLVALLTVAASALALWAIWRPRDAP